MPSNISEFHDSAIEKFINLNIEGRAFFPERLVLAKTKGNFLVPVHVYVKVRMAKKVININTSS